MLEHDTTTPDIETASEAYAQRFSGRTGGFLLEVQARTVRRLLADMPAAARVLEVGGGHAQLTPILLELGFDVWVQGSSPVCSRRLRPLIGRPEYYGRLHFVASNLWALPFPDLSFDLVLGVRLLAHVERWQDLLAEMSRVCRHRLLIDYPPIMCANFFERWIFRWKRDIEGNTRPYFSYSFGELSRALYSLGFERLSLEKQFFVPIVVHRALARQGLSRAVERGSRTLGLTRLFGGPVLLCAELPTAGAGLEPRPAKSEGRTVARSLLIAPQPFFTPGGRP